MTTPIFNLSDLNPTEAQFTLKTFPDKVFTLCRWSLRVRSWALRTYGGPEGLKQIFESRSIEKIAEMAYFMLKEKDQFPTQDDFFDNVCGPRDELALMTALMTTIGIGEPEIKKINEMLEGKGEPAPKPVAPKKKIGAKSSTR